MDPTQVQLMSEIVSLLELSQAEVSAINDDFQELVSANSKTTADMITACKVYDSASFLAGAMISTSVLDIIRANLAEKTAEHNRLEGNFRDVI